MNNASQLLDFLYGYMDAAVFADLPEKHLGEGIDRSNVDEESVHKARQDCISFLALALPLIMDDEHVPGSHDDTPMNHAGRDFYYTRCGHGCGYWDGDWPKHGDELTRIAETFKEVYLEVYNLGDDYDGPLYFVSIE